MKAMIFAAGEGTRLRPLTLTKPKALVEVAGRPMLAWVLDAVKRAGVKEAVVNVHYLGEQIIDYLKANDFGLNIQIADERKRLLDTGGGLLAARGLLGDSEPILLHNADILTSARLDRLELRGLASLLVADRPSSRKLVFNGGLLTGWVNETTGQTKGNAQGVKRAFQGVHVVSPEIFPCLEKYAAEIGSDTFSLTPFYLSAPNVYGQELGNYEWHDIGSPEKLAAAAKAYERI